MNGVAPLIEHAVAQQFEHLPALSKSLAANDCPVC